MIIQGEIQRADRNQFERKGGIKVDEVRLIVMDKSKLFRCMTPFQIGVSLTEFAVLFPKKTPTELSDEKVTLVCHELTPFGNNLNVRGRVLPGHIAADVIAAADAKASQAAA